MGATNAMLAYQLYAGRVPATSMQLLAYMALVSRDGDDKPWYGQGYEALALFALGRQAPIRHGDLEAVRRAMKPLLDLGAVVTDRPAAPRRDGPKTARYRLQLVPDPARGIDEPLVDNAADAHDEPAERPTDSVRNDPRNPCNRPTKNVQTTHGNHGTEEPRGTTRSEKEENHLGQVGNSPPSTGTHGDDKPSTTIAAPRDPSCPSCSVLLDPDGRCRHRTCERYLAPVVPIRSAS